MKCPNCGKREATEIWNKNGSDLEVAHGMYQQWCEICVLEAQLDHAKKIRDGIPALVDRLFELRAKEKGEEK
jgi:hypothetical protein